MESPRRVYGHPRTRPAHGRGRYHAVVAAPAMSPSAYHDQARPEVVALVPRGSWDVLDVGCGSGRLGAALLRDGRATAVDGIEIQEGVADAARRRLRAVVVGDLDDADVLDRPGLQTHYDVVIVADVLEHLREPWLAAERLAARIRPGGLLVASVPNVRYWAVTWPLVVRGEWAYRPSGVLDRTHLRFFTRRSAVDMLRRAGLTVETVVPGDAYWRTGWKRLVGRALRDFGAEQFLLVARRPRSRPGDNAIR